jgi:hypothetical protein
MRHFATESGKSKGQFWQGLARLCLRALVGGGAESVANAIAMEGEAGASKERQVRCMDHIWPKLSPPAKHPDAAAQNDRRLECVSVDCSAVRPVRPSPQMMAGKWSGSDDLIAGDLPS